MNDGSDRRPKRQFEPPPWEREAFDELAKKRAAEEAARKRAAAESAAPGSVVEVVRERVASPAQPPSSEGREDQAEEQRVSRAEIDTMLMGLASEEPRSWRDWTLGAWVAVGLGLAGAFIALYGLLAMTRGAAMVPDDKKSGVLAMGGMIAAGGAILVGMAAWVGMRSYARRGE